MPTNEERREAARRLREIGKELGRGTMLWFHISKALGVDLTIGGEAAANVLADLIEPEPERTCKIVNSENKFANWECSACGEEIKYSDNYCPNCGAKVVE